jgi:hypothetical protein
MMNLKLVERQPHWRVWLVVMFAKLVGVTFNVEGIPFGSNRSRKPAPKGVVATAQGGSTGASQSQKAAPAR